MLAKYTIAGLAGSVLLAAFAFAQTPTATTDTAQRRDGCVDTRRSRATGAPRRWSA